MTAFRTDELLVKVRKRGRIEVLLKPFKLNWFSKHIFAYFLEELETLKRLDSIDLRPSMLNLMIKKERMPLYIF